MTPIGDNWWLWVMGIIGVLCWILGVIPMAIVSDCYGGIGIMGCIS
jgi:hypothetical protein